MSIDYSAYRRLQSQPFEDTDGRRSQALSSTRTTTFLTVIICLQSVGLLTAAAVLYRRNPDCVFSQPAALYSPAQQAIEHVVTIYPLGFGHDLSPFQTPSSPELDQAWEDLYSFGISRIPRHQAERLPNRTHAIPGDPGYYIAELDVFHELHCLNMIRKALDPEYYPDWRITVVEKSREHVSHCVDWLRLSIMCHSDTSVIVWQWNERYNVSTPKATIPHTCRNFDRIHEWGKQNALVGEYDETVHIEDNL